MIEIKINSLSINGAFKGRRFKTPEYTKFERAVLLMLPKISIGKAPYSLSVEFGVSTKLKDLDNGLKPFIDCLVKKYDFDDRDIYFLYAKKVIVPKGNEYIKFEFLQD